MIGKGHLGYTTMDHLPANRGFDTHVGYLGGAEDYHWGNQANQGVDQGSNHCSATARSCPKDMCGQRLNVACTEDGALKLDDDQAWRQDRLAISMWVDPMVPLEQLDARYAELREANFTVCRGYFIITLDNILLKVFLKINKVSYDRSSWRKRGSGRQTAPAA